MVDRRHKPASSAPGDGSKPEQPHHAPRTQAEKAARQTRLAAEMRKNLLKRKRQQRARNCRKIIDLPKPA